MSFRILFVFGTRPEAIKLAPLIHEMKRHSAFDVKVCVTAQHRQMLDQVLAFFGIRPDYDLNIMKANQSLFDVTSDCMKALEPVLTEVRPSMVLVQGDTTTAFTGALAAYYKKVRVAHIEAGLRSGNKYSPFPEEINRLLTSHLADLHFTPTQRAADHLKKENISKGVFQVGNTVIDALFLGLNLVRQMDENTFMEAFPGIHLDRRIVLITGHRRESFGEPFEQLSLAIRDLAESFPDVEFIYPVHLNPNVREPVNRILGGLGNVKLIGPLDYPHFIWLMERSYLVLTDSGGLQEEAPSLGKPVIVMRDVTERQEGVDAGTAKLVGTRREVIVREMKTLLTDEGAYQAMAKSVNPYGDGKSCGRIAAHILDYLNDNE